MTRRSQALITPGAAGVHAGWPDTGGDDHEAR